MVRIALLFISSEVENTRALPLWVGYGLSQSTIEHVYYSSCQLGPLLRRGLALALVSIYGFEGSDFCGIAVRKTVRQ